MSKRKSLAEDLAELFNPAPAAEADPDAIDLDVSGAGDYASQRDIEDDDEPAAKKASRSAREKGLQLRGEIDMGDDAAYKGRRSSRAEMYGEDESDGDMDDDLDLSQHAGAGQSDSDDESGDDSEDGDGEGEDGLDTGDEGEDGLDTGDEEQAAPAVVKAKAKAEQKAKAGKKAKAGTEAGGDAELKALEDEYRGAREEDEEAMVTMRQKSGQERSKGLAVKNQQVLYDKSLEMRILLQKVMVGAAALPRTGAHALAVQQHPALSDRFTALQGQLCAMLTSLGGLHDALLANNPAIATASSAPTPAAAAAAAAPDGHTAVPSPSPQQAQAQAPLSSDVMWGRLQHQHAQLCGYRDASLDRWHRRTALSSGAATGLKGGALKALNQSISQQVAAVLRDPIKLLKRTRLQLALRPPILCEPRTALPGGASADEQAAATVLAADQDLDLDDEDVRDPETFDDTEFYQQLLKEFLDNQGVAGGGASARGLKKRKAVDRRASKGRKIRYNVQEKLLNFLAPVSCEVPPFAAQLFANLFGHGGMTKDQSAARANGKRL
ncbi:MAG: hypothetical protein WDW36_003569 [Sanguina aurantia]